MPALFARIAEIGSSAIPGSDHCGVSIERRRSAVTVAGSSPVAAEVDAIQNDVGEGPGLAAMRADHLYEVADVATDPRWPRFGARIAAETPVRSLLTYRLFVADRTVGALSVFAERAHAFDRRSHEHASLLAAHARSPW
ncbi:MAG: GAF domain-containing protein [Acidimicrobiales bacterium]